MQKYILWIFYLYSISYAENIPEKDILKINEQNKNILQNEKNRLNFFETKNKSRGVKILNEYYKIDKNSNQTKNCFNINKIELIGNKILSKDIFEPIFTKYINYCLNQKIISNLLNEINNKYIKSGYITTKSYLKEQDLSSKILKINIQEGKIENILINNKNSFEVFTIFPNYKDKYLNLRDIEMGLEQLNRLNTTSVTLDLKEGSKNGYSIVDIHKEQDKKVYTTFSINNNGSVSTGKDNGSLQIYIEDLLYLNSKLILNLSGTLKQLDEKRTVSHFYSWSIPYGYYLFSIGYREFLYRSTITGQNSKYISSGISNVYFYKLNSTFYRDDKNIFKFSLGIDIKENINFIANQIILTSSNKLTVGTLSFEASSSIGNTSFHGTLALKKGLPLFDALKDSDRMQKALFSAETFNLSAYTNLKIFDIPVSFSNLFSGQYSEDNLYNTELFSIGGLYSVRGFKNMSYSGGIGANLQNDLSYSIRQKLLGEVFSINPFIGYDVGLIKYNGNFYKHMVGSAIGIKLQHQFLSVDFTIGIPLYAYDPILEEKSTFSFSIQFQY